MVHIEIRVLQILAHGSDGFLDVLCIFALRISKNHFGFISFDIVGKIQLFILVKHRQEVLVVLYTLTLVDHVEGNTLHH